ncbi:mitochondrial intermembrane space import and assembly protein 40-B-like isoform X2 [Amphiura filiformis]|uniref:mitochondrial intermembrane space import and assembly protein 40-B-like isoform X2 n=1 Tax=Amphiura filiformis TaxID=82378 RepID=UPI003B2144C5
MKNGKDRIIFVTKEDHGKDPIAEDDYEDEQEGLINEDGSINWDCPCLGGMASGPCGVEFRESFTCFHYSIEEPKGVECVEQFKTLHECMVKYPEYYARTSGKTSDEGLDGDGDGNEEKEEEGESSQSGETETDAGKDNKAL